MTHAAPPEQDLARIVQVLSEHDSVALACHVNPDGDALGSMLGFFHAWTGSGRTAVASFSEPFTVATHYRDVPGLPALCKPADFPAQPEVMLTFDCGSRSRLGDLEASAAAATELIVLDHHLSNERYGTLNLVVPHAPATAAVVVDLLDALHIPLNREAAIGLYIGLVCDTGRFQYEATTADTFALAERLMAFDLPIADIGRHLFDEHRFAYVQLLGNVLSNAVLDPEVKLVWATIPIAVQEQFGIAYEELEAAIDIVRTTAEAEVACVLKEDADGQWRGSLRSTGTCDVSQLAAIFGGGGHRYAAGFTATEAPEHLIAQMKEHLQRL